MTLLLKELVFSILPERLFVGLFLLVRPEIRVTFLLLLFTILFFCL